jgi:hypothetical protein
VEVPGAFRDDGSGGGYKHFKQDTGRPLSIQVISGGGENLLTYTMPDPDLVPNCKIEIRYSE